MAATEANVKLAIKDNNCATNDPCALCGARTDPDVGPELFMADSWALVCHECGAKYAPALMAGLMPAQEAWELEFRRANGEAAEQAPLVEENPFMQETRWLRSATLAPDGGPEFLAEQAARFAEARRMQGRERRKGTPREEAWKVLDATDFGYEAWGSNLATVRGEVRFLLSAADCTLGQNEAACNSEGIDELRELGDLVAEMYGNLEHAIPAMRLLATVQRSLVARAKAIAEVMGCAPLDVSDFESIAPPAALLPAEQLPERWRPVVADDGDIPF